MARKNKNCPRRKVCPDSCVSCEFDEAFSKMQTRIATLRRRADKSDKAIEVLVSGTPTRDVAHQETARSADSPVIGCEYCAPLLACPVGEKRRVHICGNPTYSLTEMVLDRYESHTEVFIHTDYSSADYNDGYYCNTAYDIAYCPFCGRKLKEDTHETE